MRKKLINHTFESDNRFNCFIFSFMGQTASAGITANQQQRTNESNEALTRETNKLNAELTRETNAQNKAIADQNLQFQKNTLDYQKALQQQIFEREDTAFSRAAQDASSLGINPMAMIGNSAGAGEAINVSPLHNDMQYQQPPAMVAPHHESPIFDFSGIGSLDNVPYLFRDMDEHIYQRDSIRSAIQNDEVDRAIKLYEAGLGYDNKGNIVPIDKNKVREEVRDLNRRNNNYENYGVPSIPNYPAIATHVLDNASQVDTEKLKSDVAQIIDMVRDMGVDLSTQGKIGETIYNKFIQAEAGNKDAEEFINKLKKQRELRKLARQKKKAETKASKIFKQNQVNNVREMNDYPFNSNGSYKY